MKYKIIERLSGADCKKLSLLIDKCNGYEPFYLTEEDTDDFSPNELRQLAAYDDNGDMAGFISFIYNEDSNCRIALSAAADYYADLSHGMPKDLPELTALVAPKYRRQGIFSEMLSQIKAATGIDAFIVSGNLRKEAAFSEYLMKLTNDMHNKCDTPDIRRKYSADTKETGAAEDINDIKAAASAEDINDTENVNNNEYLFRFEEQDSVYVMYDASPTSKEIAYCRLSFQPSFSVIYSVYVDEKLRGNGLGSIFMKHFIADYFSKCAKPLVLNVRSINIPALRLYEKCSFKIVETVKYYVI